MVLDLISAFLGRTYSVRHNSAVTGPANLFGLTYTLEYDIIKIRKSPHLNRITGIKPNERKYTEMNNAKKKRYRIIKRRISVFILLFAAVFHLFPMGVWANSAMKEWNGTDASGVAITDKYCPVTVKHEKLTFNLPAFPDYYYSDASELNNYRASVTARYEFYNPKDYEVTAALAFPFGAFPDYVDSGNEDFYSPATLDRYGVKLNGEYADAVIRHTYFDKYGENFEITEQLARLRSDFSEMLDCTVTAYTYKVTDTVGDCYASFKVGGIGEGRYLITDTYQDYYSVHKDEVGVGIYIDEAKGRDGFTVYIVGDPLDGAVDPRLFENSRELEEAQGTVTLKYTETVSLYELAMTNHDPEGSITEIDRFNAVVDCMLTNWERLGRIISVTDIMSIDTSLMRWYTYEMTVPAEGTVVNEVTAPIYPDIDGGMEPSVYTYTYLLSPARSWAGFGPLDIEIITPYYLIECDIFPKFEKTESGYATSLNGLPSGELKFTLSSDPSPKREITPYTLLGIGIYAVIIGAAVAVPAAVVTVTVILVKKRRKTR